MKVLVFLSLFCGLYWPCYAAINLEQEIDSAFVEARQMVIPGYPDAFNPSIVRFRGKLLLSFRFRDPLNFTNPFGLVWLNEEFEPISDVQEFYIQFDHYDSFCQDPRLIVYDDKTLYIVWSNLGFYPDNSHQRRVYTGRLRFVKDMFILEGIEPILFFPKELRGRQEKNWVPFIYKEKLHLAYSLTPHRIMKPVFGTATCKMAYETDCPIPWDWGELRGGTPAIRVGKSYLAFFHSYKNMVSDHSKGKKISHYFIGAYRFSSVPPFELLAISEKPIFGPNFYTSDDYPTWKPLRVLFPAGFVVKGKEVWVSFGKQDYEMWMLKLNLDILDQNLRPLYSSEIE